MNLNNKISKEGTMPTSTQPQRSYANGGKQQTLR